MTIVKTYSSTLTRSEQWARLSGSSTSPRRKGCRSFASYSFYLFQGEHSDKNFPEMSVNVITPVTKSSRTNKPLSLSYQDPPVYPYRTKSRERTLMSVGRIDKALEYRTPRNEVVHTCETD